MGNEIDISVVVPVYKGSTHLPELTNRVAEVMLKMQKKYELIFVDDQSPDHSWTIINKLAEKHREVIGLKLKLNCGQHNATLAGISESVGHIIVTMDNDLQHDPEDIPSLVDEINAGNEVVYGRFLNRKHRKWRVWGSQFNNLIASFLMDKPINLYLSPFRAIKSTLREEMLHQQAPSVYLDGIILLLTRNISCVEVNHKARVFGKSSYSLASLINLCANMVTSHSVLPLRAATLLGLFFSVAGFLLAIFIVIQKVTIDFMPIGWSSLLTTMLILSGVQLLVLGIIGEYLGRIFKASSNAPAFIIETRLNKRLNEK